MRFMVMALADGYGPAARTAAAGAEATAKMMAYHTSLQKAGVLLALDELSPPFTGARISYLDGKPTVTDGPIEESREILGGYWIIQVRSREEAIEWAKRAPMSNHERTEVRQIHERSDSPEDVENAREGFEPPTR